MTRPDTDQLHVGINAGAGVVELAPGATKIDRRIHVEPADEQDAAPARALDRRDGKTVVAPNT